MAIKKGFTLVELIIVIIIVGILASLGLTQYSLVVEKSRLVEAKIRIGDMRQLAYGYYSEGGAMDGMQNSDVGGDTVCTSSSFFSCAYEGIPGPGGVYLSCRRCTSLGKSPNTSKQYVFYMNYYPATGTSTWHCSYVDTGAGCFGFSP